MLKFILCSKSKIIKEKLIFFYFLKIYTQRVDGVKADAYKGYYEQHSFFSKGPEKSIYI